MRKTTKRIERGTRQAAKTSAGILASFMTMAWTVICLIVKWSAIVMWECGKWIVKGLMALGALIATGASHLMDAIAKWVDSRKSSSGSGGGS